MIALLKKLPQWAQMIIILVILVVVFLILRELKKFIEVRKSSAGARKEVNTNEDRMNELAAQGVIPTISRADAESMANAIQEAADGCDGLGQGGVQIMARVYACQNEADWRQLVDAFGTRTWDACGYFTGDTTGSLTTCMISELNTSQLAEARRHLGQFGVTF